MVNQYDDYRGSNTDVTHYEANEYSGMEAKGEVTRTPADSNMKVAGEVIQIRPSNLERDIAGARRQVESERSFNNIGAGQSFSTNNLTVFKPK